MSIPDKLISVSQRETSGEDTDNAFAYQKNWAIYKLMKIHQLGHDYVVLFEYHDDVVILDSLSPNLITFNQIKKSDHVQWTINRLLTRGEDLNSILGKLYLHRLNFKDESIQLNFVSNAGFAFSPMHHFNAAVDIHANDQKSISTRIEEELKTSGNIDLSILNFEKSELSLEGHEKHLKGFIIDFINSSIGENSSVRPNALYDLFQRIGERSRVRSDRIKTFREAVKLKGVAKSEIEELLRNLSSVDRISFDNIRSLISVFSRGGADDILYRTRFQKIMNLKYIEREPVLCKLFDAIKDSLDIDAMVEGTENEIMKIWDNISRSPEFKAWRKQDVIIIAAIAFCEIAERA